MTCSRENTEKVQNDVNRNIRFISHDSFSTLFKCSATLVSEYLTIVL